MLAHLLYCFVAEEYPQVLLENLSKNSQGSLFVSLFNFQGPLPLKRRAFCILPHLRRFVNTFFAACPFFLPAAFSALFAFARPPSFKSSKLSLENACLFYQTTSPLSTPFSPFFFPSLHPSARSFLSLLVCMNFPTCMR